MALSPADRKAKLGLGGLTRIKGLTNKSLTHVSEVNALHRFDQGVRDAISAEIIALNPNVDPSSIWPSPEEDPTPRAAKQRAIA